jgi:hypothetical protein
MQFKYNESSVEGLEKEPFQEPFCAAPHRIWLDASFTFSARSFSAWAYGKPIGWIFKIEHLCMELGLSRQQWRTIRTELKERGVFVQDKQKIGDHWHWIAKFNFTIFKLSQKVEEQPIAREGLKSTTRETGRGHAIG